MQRCERVYSNYCEYRDKKCYLQKAFYNLQRISDANILVVILAANVIEALALGLREAFAKYKTTVNYHNQYKCRFFFLLAGRIFIQLCYFYI